MEIICLSDTHELHRDVRVPDGDMLIYAGDIAFFSKNPSVLTDFNDWLGELSHKYKVVIPGNHDRLLEQPKHQRTIANAHLLINAGIELGGLKIWGSPVTPYADTAFGIPSAEARVKHWKLMPTGWISLSRTGRHSKSSTARQARTSTVVVLNFVMPW